MEEPGKEINDNRGRISTDTWFPFLTLLPATSPCTADASHPAHTRCTTCYGKSV